MTVLFRFFVVSLAFSSFVSGFSNPGLTASQATTISYEGYLTDSSGDAITDTLDMSIGIHTTSSGGVATYEEDHDDVSVSNGVFQVLLGGGAATTGSWAGVDFSVALWVETTVEGETLSPRVQLHPVAYARHANAVSDNAVDGTDIALGSDAQGDIMYYDGSDWARLGAGTSGQVLQTQGAGSDPVWVSESGGASQLTELNDVGSSTATSGNLLVADGSNWDSQTIDGDISIDNSGRVTIANNSVDGTDIALGSDAQGDIMYYDGSDWNRLMAGTSGQVLQTQGGGSDPVWATVSSGASQLTELSDVGSSTATSGNLLVADGSNWDSQTIDGDISIDSSGRVTIANNSVDGTDIALGSDAEGDIMYYDGSDWARLGAGPSGRYLQSQGSSNPPTWAAVSGGSSSYMFSGAGYDEDAGNDTVYFSPNGSSSGYSGPGGFESLIPAACTAQDLYVSVGAYGGDVSSGTIQVSLYQNTSATSLNCSVSSPITNGNYGACSDTSSTVSLSAGDRISIQVVNSSVSGDYDLAYGFMCQ